MPAPRAPHAACARGIRVLRRAVPGRLRRWRTTGRSRRRARRRPGRSRPASTRTRRAGFERIGGPLPAASRIRADHHDRGRASGCDADRALGRAARALRRVALLRDGDDLAAALGDRLPRVLRPGGSGLPLHGPRASRDPHGSRRVSAGPTAAARAGTHGGRPRRGRVERPIASRASGWSRAPARPHAPRRRRDAARYMMDSWLRRTDGLLLRRTFRATRGSTSIVGTVPAASATRCGCARCSRADGLETARIG